MNKVYSRDDENFNFSSLDELFDDLAAEGLLNIGEVYYSAESTPFNPEGYIRVDNLLEELDARIYDDLGECYNYDLSGLPIEAKDNLKEILSTWMNKHVSMNYWTIKGKSIECTIQEGDIYEH